MLELTYSNRTEALLERLAGRIQAERAEGRGPWEAVHLVVPNGHIKEYVRTGLARHLGIAANLRFSYLGGLTGHLLGEATARILDARLLRAGLLGALEDAELLAEPVMAPVRHYLDRDPGGLKRIQFSGELARILEEYQLSRPEWIESWREERLTGDLDEGSEAWQARLWREVLRRLDGAAPEPHLTLLEATRLGSASPRRAIHAFALSHVAQAYQELYRAFVDLPDTTLHLYALNPCEEFWEDLAIGRERARRGRWDGATEDFYHLTEEGPRALRLWGRPGRENIRLLNEISACDFSPAFREPTGDTLLARMQRDILAFRDPAPESTGAPDGSIRLIAAPSPRREAEIVATGIWRLMEAHQDSPSPLSFSDIAVLVPPDSLELYQAHLQAAFAETHRIPMVPAGRDLPEMQELLEAVELLLELPTTGLTRAALLRVIQHRAVLREQAKDPALGAWPRWCEEHGIIRGADRGDWRETYVDRDLLSWDQGLKRIALGAFMAEGTELILGEERYRIQGARDEAAAATLAALVRGLCAEARELLHTRLEPRAWMEHLAGYFERWLEAEEGEEAEGVLRALERIRRTLQRTFEGCPEGLGLPPIGFAAARELALEALAGLGEDRPASLSRGVVVATCEALRALPFRAVFCMGLGEGSFPTKDPRSPLDLRRKLRKPGDVSRTERQTYTFLETLLCTREHLVLSYVAMDELSGEAAQPSGLYLEFRELLGAYLGPEWAPSEPGEDRLLERHPLRRFDPDCFREKDGLRSYAPIAWEEARARTLGEAARAAGIVPPLAVGDLEGLGSGDRTLLREALALPALPATVPVREVLRLRLSELRSFLECPLSGAARVRLGLRRDELEDRTRVEDEPFEQDNLQSTLLRRRVTLEALAGGEPAEQAYDQVLQGLQASGQAPLGLFAEAERGENLEMIEAWVKHLAGEGGPTTCRLGPNQGHRRQAERALPPLGLELELELEGRSLHVELVGDLSPQLDGSLFLEKGAPPTPSKLARYRKRALAAYLDHLVLACMTEDHLGHCARFVFAEATKKGEQEYRIPFGPLSPAEASGELRAWVADLLTGRHDVLLPIEAVIENLGKGPLETEAILDYVEKQTESGERAFFSTVTGPVPDPLRYPPPAEPEPIVQRRLGAFLKALCPSAASPEEA